MDERSKETYEETLDHLSLELYAKENAARKDAERWVSGYDHNMPALSKKREDARCKRESKKKLAEAEAFKHAREAVDRLLKDGDTKPLTQAYLEEFEAVVFDAFKHPEALAPMTRMVYRFEHMSPTQRHQAWKYVSGREPPPTEKYEHQGFLATHLKHLLPDA